MGNGGRQFNVSHSLTAHRGLCDLYAALITDHAFIADLLILAAVTLPVLDRSENALAEKSVLLRLQGTVIDRFGLFHLAVRPLADLLRGREPDADRIKIQLLFRLFFLICLRHVYAPFDHSLSSSSFRLSMNS